MNKINKIYLFVIAMLSPLVTLCQVPDGFNYQAILRDGEAKEIVNENITVKFGVLSGSVTGTLIWEEEHITTTNEFGHFSLVLGEGTNSGGTLGSFSDIAWGSTSIFLKVSINVGGTWSYFDPSPLLSVPYSNTALTAADDFDRDPANEKIGSAILTGSSIVITEGGVVHTIDMTDLIANAADNQQITLVDNILYLDRSSSVDLSGYNYSDPDNDPNNEMITTLNLSGTVLMINESGNIKSVDLSTLQDGVGTDNQQLTFVGNILYLDRSGSVDLSSLMDGTGTDNQQLSLGGDNLTLEDGGNVNLAGYRDNPFTMNGDTLVLLNGSVSIGSDLPMKSKLAVISQDDLSEDALFEVRRADGQTVFAVYNEGVRIYLPIEPVTKGPRGGFAIGGFDRNKGIIVEDYLWVTPDSIRMYIDKTPELLKGPRGGFAIGGFDRNKVGETTDYFMLSADSTRFYIDDTNTKGPRGGFAIGGFDRNKGYRQNYMSVTDDSTRIYVQNEDAGFSVANVSTGTAQNFMKLNKENYFIGHESGTKINPAIGRFNAFIGFNAGFDNTNGIGNTFVGYQSGFKNLAASYNVYLGYETGKDNVAGNNNVFLGFRAGNISSTSKNVFVGASAGSRNSDGSNNTYLGAQSGVDDGAFVGMGFPSGTNNTFIGQRAGAQHYTGNNNVYIGSTAGEKSYGVGRIFVGFGAGNDAPDTDNLLYIENSASNIPLIYGNFGSDLVQINGSLVVTEGITDLSDLNLKTGITDMGNTLEMISSLKVFRYSMKPDLFQNKSVSDKLRIGVMAQDLEKLFPELVGVSSQGYKTVEYSKIGVLLIPAVRELNQKMKKQEEEINELKRAIELLIIEVNQLKEQ